MSVAGRMKSASISGLVLLDLVPAQTYYALSSSGVPRCLCWRTSFFGRFGVQRGVLVWQDGRRRVRVRVQVRVRRVSAADGRLCGNTESVRTHVQYRRNGQCKAQGGGTFGGCGWWRPEEEWGGEGAGLTAKRHLRYGPTGPSSNLGLLPQLLGALPRAVLVLVR